MNSSIIQAWLQEHANRPAEFQTVGAASRKRTRHVDAHDGTDSANSEMSSPKRRRESSPAQADETPRPANTVTPTSSYAGSLAMEWPRLRREQSPTKASSRSGSPTKPTTINNLASLETPVRFVYPDNIAHAIGDEEGRALWQDLRRISRDDKILPSAIRSELENLVGNDYIEEGMWDGDNVREDSGKNQQDTSAQREQRRLRELAARHELLLIRQLTTDTCRAEQRRKAEAGWNEDVHKPTFRLALGAHPVVQAENVASARLASPFRPPLADPDDDVASVIDAASSVTDTGSSKGGAVYHKMVDYVLVLDTDLAQSASDAAIYASLSRRIKRFVDAQPRAEQWINAVQYEALRYFPAGVTVETKTNAGTREEAWVQLGVWIAAWHRRMRLMLDSRGRTRQKPQDQPPGSSRRLLSLPAILVFNGSWELVIVVEARGATPEQHETHVVGPGIQIGNTYTVLGVYRLLASLRRLATWMETDFRTWMEGTLTWIGC